ncbi:MAG: hypothetical protein KIT84_30460 [Labilithrix sp.]|nr:hypothetical protein [Labilithrix sp.]MCW5815389.1 hypothetical protein [Labilithrix sp.]
MKTSAALLGFASQVTLLAFAACSGDDDPAAPADAGFERTLTEPDAYRPPSTIDTGPPPTKLPSGEGLSIVYSGPAPIGIDARPDMQATFDADGALNGFYVSDDENLSIGIASNAGAGADLLAAWGAWREGPTTGTWYTVNGRFIFGEGDDFHYAVGQKSPTAKWPAATKSYALLGGSAPTVVGVAEAGTIASASATCDLGARQCSALGVNATGGGGTLALAATDVKIESDAAGAGQVRAPGFVATFAGDAAERMLVVFDGKLPDGPNAGKTIRGAIVLTASP